MTDLVNIMALIRAELSGGGLEYSLHDREVWVRRSNDRVVITDTAEILEMTDRGRALLDAVRRGEILLVLVGDVNANQARALVNKGVFDIHPDRPDVFRLTNSIRNGLDLQSIRRRASSSSRRLRRSRYELRELIESAVVMSSKLNIDDLLETILHQCQEVTAADAGTIYLVEGEGPIEGCSLRAKLARNDSIDIAWQEFVIPISRKSMAGAAVLDREVINIDDVRNLPEGAEFSHNISFDMQSGYHTRSILTAPMMTVSGEIVGVVQLLNRKRSKTIPLLFGEDFEKHVIPFDQRNAELVMTLTAHAAVSYENALLYEEIRVIFDGLVKAAIHAMEQRDPPTSGHSERVKTFTMLLARLINETSAGPLAHITFSEQELMELEYAALLHDFGKIGVKEAVLTKPKKLPEGRLEVIEQRFEAARISRKLKCLQPLQEGVGEAAREEVEARLAAELEQLERAWELIKSSNEPRYLDQGAIDALEKLSELTYTDSQEVERHLVTQEELQYLSIRKGSLSQEELVEIKSHARKTHDFLTRIPWGKNFANLPIVASSHHERPDGTGYPDGLDGTSVPLRSKIMAVADIFDALTAADRPYKKAIPVKRALDILKMESESNHLDAELVRLFIEGNIFTHCDASKREES